MTTRPHAVTPVVPDPVDDHMVDDYLVDVVWLAAHLDQVLVVDCRFGGDRDSSLVAYRGGICPVRSTPTGWISATRTPR